MNEDIRIKRNGGLNYLYVGDAIYLIDKENLSLIKTNINKKDIKRLIGAGKIKVSSLWNLIYYDIIITD